MSQTLRPFHWSAFLNSRVFVKTLSIEAVSVVSIIGLIGISPAQADPPHIPVPEPQTAGNYRVAGSQTTPNQGWLPPPTERGKLTSRFSETSHQTSSIESSTPVAAVANPRKQIIPTLPSRKPIERSEDELIQQMSGKPAASSATRTATSPVFYPPSSAQIPHRRDVASTPVLPPQPGLESASLTRSVNTKTRENPEILVTAKTNSDVGLGLLAPRQNSEGSCSSSQTCYDQVQPTAQTISPSIPSTVQPGTPAGAPVSDPKGNPLEESPQINPPSSLPSERLPTQRAVALSSPVLQLQGVILNQGDQVSGRARVSGVYPLTPNIQVGGTLDFTQGIAFADSRQQGVSLNELYLAASIPDFPNLRFVLGQIDLTSYFDRNSFAKDGATHFFNPVFQTNPALSVTGISSRLGGLVNWTLTDNIEAKAAIFSSSRRVGDFNLDGFAGEVGIRYGNAIVRGTYATDRDSGVKDGFQEIFQVPRGNNSFGPRPSDREESYGVNTEVFFPSIKLGLFGRYGHYRNNAINVGGDTYSAGLNFLDLFAPYDRLGIAYGRNLSNDRLRIDSGAKRPDALELFYDFRIVPNLRLGVTVQERKDFSETILGVRLKTEFDVNPFGRQR